MAIQTFKALSPVELDRDIRPGDTFDADPAALAHLTEGVDYIAVSGGSTKASAPTDAADREAAITAAIQQLDPNDADLWLRDGKPDVSAIVAITGWPVSAAERNVVWDKIKPAA